MAENRKTSVLTKERSIARANSIKKGSIEYKIFLNLNKGDSFRGIVFVSFDIIDDQNIFLDFCGDKVDQLFINGDEQDLTSSEEAYESFHREGHIFIPQDTLRGDNQNTIEIHFSNRYYRDGNGLHSYVDVDGEQYVYIQSEPYWGNRVLPYFDQPDLKARFVFHALIPEDWKLVTSVIANSVQKWSECNNPSNGLFRNSIFREFKEAPLQGEYSYWRFPQSAILPTYLFSFAAGPFWSLDLEESKRFKNLPMTLYCRKTMVEFVEPQSHNVFEYNKRGVEYYEQTFGMDYMFTKLDTIVCPEYTIGAMEYPAAVTYSERLFPRGENSIEDITARGSTIMHELAHMWFGNAVSVQWWNETWLKESFADFCCYICAQDTAHLMGFETSPAMNRFLCRKCWGYEEDFQCTSHPIAAQIESTQEADGVFDGISYSKGAAVLKQLVFLIGFENFKKAMKVYFERFAWKNTELKDLLEVYQETLGDLAEQHPALDVIQWGKDWLETPGTNTLSLEWSPESTQGIITQTAARDMFPTLRYHKIRIGLFDQNAEVIRTVDVYINNTEKTEVELGDLSNVSAILLNYEDHDFAIIQIDSRSSEFFKQNYAKITDELTRTIIFKSYYDMVRSQAIPGSEICELTVAALVPSITNYSLNTIFLMVDPIMTNYMRQEERNHYCHLIFQKLLEINRTVEDKESDKATVIFEQLIGHSFHNDDIMQLYHFYMAFRNGMIKTKIGINTQWRLVSVIQNSTEIPQEERQRIFDELYAEDKTDTKIQYKIIIESKNSRGEQRLDIMRECLEEHLKFSFHHLQYRLMGLNSAGVPEAERAAVFKLYGQNIKELINNRSRSIGKSFIRCFSPRLDDLSEFYGHIVEASESSDIDQFTRKKMMQLRDDIELIQKSRAVQGN